MTEGKKLNSTTRRAGVTGFGGGTLLASLVNHVPDSSPYKYYLVLAVPTATLLIGAFSIWLQLALVNYAKRVNARRIVNRLRRTLNRVISDPNASEERRKYAKDKLEELYFMQVNDDLKALESITPSTTKDVITFWEDLGVGENDKINKEGSN